MFNVFLSLCAATASVTHRQTRQQVVCDVIQGTYKCALCLLDLPTYLPEEETGDISLGNRTLNGSSDWRCLNMRSEMFLWPCSAEVDAFSLFMDFVHTK